MSSHHFHLFFSGQKSEFNYYYFAEGLIIEWLGRMPDFSFNYDF